MKKSIEKPAEKPKEPKPPRVFKTKWFAKAASKADIADDELCEAIQEVMKGQADDLGGGVYKKRLNKNKHRSIVLAEGGQYWVYAYLLPRKTGTTLKMTSLRNFANLPLYTKRKAKTTSRKN